MSGEQIQHVPIGRIISNPQVRKKFDQASIISLAESFMAVGQQQPLRVRAEGDHFVLVDGERRLRAGQLREMATMAVIVETASLDDADVLQRQLIANIQREDLQPLERARGIQQLKTLRKCTASEVAKLLAMSPATVTRLLALLSLPEELQRRIESGELSPSAAYELSRIEDTTEQGTRAEQVLTRKLTRDGLVAASKSARRQKSGDKPEKALNRVTAVLGDGRSVTVAAADLNLESFITVLEELLTQARRIRPQGLSLQTFARMLKEKSQPVHSAQNPGGPHATV